MQTLQQKLACISMPSAHSLVSKLETGTALSFYGMELNMSVLKGILSSETGGIFL
jgi:hypothetical protein